TINKLVRTTRYLVQELGRERIPEEIAERMSCHSTRSARSSRSPRSRSRWRPRSAPCGSALARSPTHTLDEVARTSRPPARPAAFEMDEILYELRDHASGLNAGRWDYLFSAIKKLRDRPGLTIPDRGHRDLEAQGFDEKQ